MLLGSKALALCAATFFSSLLANAEVPFAKSCSDADVQRITRPYFPGQKKSKTFELAFRYRQAYPGMPTVIYLPGGPGETSINGSLVPLKLPIGFGLIETDPRGIGCNQIQDTLPDSFFSTEQLANDAVAIVNSLNLKKYIIHGLSYGTMVATVAAGLAERRKAPLPYAVVLEGILGRTFRNGEVFQGFIDQWNAARTQRLAPELSLVLEQEMPLGLSPSTWGRGISGSLIMGLFPGKQDYIVNLLAGLSPTADEPSRQALLAAISPVVKNDPPREQLFKAIACHEIASEAHSLTYNADFELVRGELKAVAGHLCDDIKLDRQFDARNWKTSAPIYYFEGSLDPSTPMQQAQYNFESQTKSNRTFVTVQGGGHPAFTVNLMDCKINLWVAIAAGGKDLKTALTTCSLASGIVEKASE